MAEQVTQILGIVGIKNMGVYNPETYYEKLNVVTYNGSSYCAKKNVVGVAPTNSDYWDLIASKGDQGDKGDTGDTGPAPVRGTDYWTQSDIENIEATMHDDVHQEVSTQVGELTSATPLAVSSTSGMTDTTRIYVNTTDGHWYWYDGDSWEDGGVYQATEDSDTVDILEDASKSFYNHKIDLPLARGTYSITQNAIITNNARYCCHKVLYAKNTIEVSVNQGYKLFVYYFNSDGTYKEKGMDDWQTETYYIPSGSYYRILFAKTDDSDMNLTSDLRLIQNNCFALTSNDIEEQLILNDTMSDMFTFGSYSQHDNWYYSDLRIITRNSYYTDRGILIIPDEGYKFAVYYFNDDGTFKELGTENIYNNNYITDNFYIPAGKYYMIVIGKTDNTSIASVDSVLEHIKFYTVSENNLDILRKLLNISDYSLKVVKNNIEAINNIRASKKHFDTVVEGSWGTDNYDEQFSIAHISDIHCDRTRFTNFIDFVNANQDLIDASICTGDYVINPTSGQFEFMKLTDLDVLQTVGNHDKASGGTVLTNSSVYNYLDMDTNTGKTYYYKDFEKPHYKIRLIVLNQFDIDNATERVSNSVLHYSQEQINWFINALKDAKTNGFSVMIAMHSPETFPTSNNNGFYQRHYRWTNAIENRCSGTPVEDIINAFKNGGTINQTYTYTDVANTLTVNTTFEQGNFIAYLVGHFHADLIGYSRKYNDQLYLLVTVGASISGVGGGNYGESVSDLIRTPNTKYEDAFNVYTVDLENRVVKVIRIGADVNDLLEERKKTYFAF